MALRTKTVEAAGRSFKIGNLHLRAIRTLRERVEAAQTLDDVENAQIEAIIASMERAGETPPKKEEFLDMDNDDLVTLYREVSIWGAPPGEHEKLRSKPAGEPKNP